MALMMTILTVAAMLGGITLLLWLSTFVESRHLGPLPDRLTDAQLGEPAALGGMEQVQTAA